MRPVPIDIQQRPDAARVALLALRMNFEGLNGPNQAIGFASLLAD